MPDAITRAAVLQPTTFDEQAQTIEAVASTFAPVVRRDGRGAYIERLDPAGLDLSELDGAPVLDSHRQGSARDVLGVITGHRLDGGKLIVTVRLSQAEDARPAVQRIREGVLRGLSIGYRVSKWAETTDPDTKARIRTAVAWSIHEASAVAVPADPQSRFRSQTMPKDIETEDDRAALIERCRKAHPALTDEWSTRVADAGDVLSDEEVIADARETALAARQTRTAPVIRSAAPANDDRGVILTRRADALYSRISGAAPSAEARPFMGETLRDMARAAVEAAGTSTRGMDTDQLFRAAMHTTSDFPALLTSTGNRTLMTAYQAAQSPVRKLARQTTLADFRPASRLKLSDVGLLQELSESGEIKHTTRGEAVESYALKTYATQFALSRKALINDDLGAFRDWGTTAGRMAAETEATILVNLLLSNPVLGEDGLAMFHASHGNLGTGVDLGAAGGGVDALDSGRKALRQMKGLDGKTPINATPRFLLVGPESETQAEKLLVEIYAATAGDANPFSGRMTLLVEPRITDTRWYVFADPAALPVLEYAYLSSAQGPQMASREGWDVLGMEFRVVLDFGAGPTDFRGAFFNPGQA